jgi:hypothetical protein
VVLSDIYRWFIPAALYSINLKEILMALYTALVCHLNPEVISALIEQHINAIVSGQFVWDSKKVS